MLAGSCGGGPKWGQVYNGSVPTSDKFQRQTNTGARILAAKEITTSQIETVDADITAVIKDAIASGYANALDPNGYWIYFPANDCQLSPRDHVPSFEIRADNYDGSEFDQYNPKGQGVKDGIGVVFAAEMVLDDVSPTHIAIVACPDTPNAARNGIEHGIIAHNDPEYNNLTIYHGDGFYHPLLPKRSQ